MIISLNIYNSKINAILEIHIYICNRIHSRNVNQYCFWGHQQLLKNGS